MTNRDLWEYRDPLIFEYRYYKLELFIVIFGFYSKPEYPRHLYTGESSVCCSLPFQYVDRNILYKYTLNKNTYYCMDIYFRRCFMANTCLIQVRIDEELQKGYTDMVNGRTKYAYQTFADIHKDYGM